MRIRLVRRPGQPGTQRYVEEYGDRLICIRYRYDSATARRYKTVEIIIEEKPWQPPQTTPDTSSGFATDHDQTATIAPTVFAGPAAPLPPPPPPPPPPPRIRADTRVPPTSSLRPVRADPHVRPSPASPSKDTSEPPPSSTPPKRTLPPPAPATAATQQPDQNQQYAPDTLIAVRVEISELSLQKALRTVQARWDKPNRFWRVRYADVVRLNLQHRIIGAVADLIGEA